MTLCKYEVVVRNRPTGNRWTMFFMADDFGHAEEQAKEYLYEHNFNEEIIAINKEYDDNTERSQTT